MAEEDQTPPDAAGVPAEGRFPTDSLEGEELRVQLIKQTGARSLLDRLLVPKDDKREAEPWPVEPKVLSAMLELSNALRQNVDSYRVNIHSKGHRFIPTIRLDTPGADARVKEALFEKALLEATDAAAADDKAFADLDLSGVSEPSDSDVETRLASLKRDMTLEQARLRTFFDHAWPEGSFVDLRMISALDLEMTGNFFWEVLRDKRSLPITVYWVRSHTMQIVPQDKMRVSVQQRRRITAIDFEQIPIERAFNRFVQVDAAGTPVKWFKQFGDPRLMSSKTGTYYEDPAAFLKTETVAVPPATEIFHYKLPSLASSYGAPRWSGNVPAVLGSRELDETNLDLFRSNGIPAMLLLVAGGHMASSAYERLKEFFAEEIRGKKSMHNVAVIEAESQRKTGQQAPSPAPKIDVVPLRAAQVKDALFQEYDKSNRAKIRGDFRLPASIVGEAAFRLEDLRYADEQIYDPERDTFDSAINREFLTALGIRYWRFESIGSVLRNSDAVSAAILEATGKGVYTPDEAREFLSKILNVDAGRLHTKWASIPLPLLLALVGMKAGPAEAVREQGRQAGKPSAQEALFAELGFALPEGLDSSTVDESAAGDESGTGRAEVTQRALPSLVQHDNVGSDS